jgi:AcrR family transcriptional regulator
MAMADENGNHRQTSATRRHRALELVAEGLTPQEVAARLGVAPRTVRHYLASPDARATLSRLRDERLVQLAGRALAEVAPQRWRFCGRLPRTPPRRRRRGWQRPAS